MTTYSRHGKSRDKLFPRSLEQEMKPKQIDSSCRGGRDIQTTLKIFLQPTKPSCLCQQNEPQWTNSTLAVVTNEDVFITGSSCKGLEVEAAVYQATSTSLLKTHLSVQENESPPSFQEPCSPVSTDLRCVCDLTVYTVTLLLGSKTKTAGSDC